MKPDEIDIDWIYVIERLETLIDLGEELLSRQIANIEFDPQTFAEYPAFLWIRTGFGGELREIRNPDLQPLRNLVGIDRNIAALRRNTAQFLYGYPANNALLLGATGNGKSSCVMGLLHEYSPSCLRLIKIRRDDLHQLPNIINAITPLPYRFILFCPDLTLADNQTSCALKEVLRAWGENCPDNFVVYATSNNPELRAVTQFSNAEKADSALNAAERSVPNLADYFGLLLTFNEMNEATYLKIIRQRLLRLDIRRRSRPLEQEALNWARMHGKISGRIACQYVCDLAGRTLLSRDVKKLPPAIKI